MNTTHNILNINALQSMGGGNFPHLIPPCPSLIRHAVLPVFLFAKWLFLLLFFALFCACSEENTPHFSALDTQKLLNGTHVLLSRTTDSGIKTMEWEGHYVAFSPDSVHFFSLTPQYEFGLHPSHGAHFLGYERVPEDSFPIQYLPNAVRFDGETYRVIPSDSTFLLVGKEKFVLERGNTYQPQ